LSRETDLYAPAVRAANQLPGVEVWRQNPATVQRNRSLALYRKGIADISGWLAIEVLGLRLAPRLEIELKRSAKEKQNPDQRAFQAAIEKVGGVYVLASNVSEMCKLILAARSRIENEISERLGQWQKSS